MTPDRDPFDGPSPAGPLGEAMLRLTDDAPPAGFSEATVRGHVGHARSVRRQAFGGLGAAAAAAVTVLGGDGQLARGWRERHGDLGVVGHECVELSRLVIGGSLVIGQLVGGCVVVLVVGWCAVVGAAGCGNPRGAGQGAAAANGSTGDASAESAGCRNAPLTEAQLRAVEAVLVGATRLDDCAPSDADLGAQRYAVADGAVLVERRADGYDPCVGGAVCTEVPGRPGVRAADVDGAIHVWTGGRDGSVVLTADPAGTVGVDTLAAAAEALVAAGG